MAKRQNTKKKVKKNIPEGIVHIHSSFNNTIVTVTDVDGNAITWSSAGAVGFKGAKKSTPYAAQLAAKAVIEKAQANGIKAVSARVKGIGPGRDAALRQFQASDIEVRDIKNVTPIPHNGVKKKKKFRRV